MGKSYNKVWKKHIGDEKRHLCFLGCGTMMNKPIHQGLDVPGCWEQYYILPIERDESTKIKNIVPICHTCSRKLKSMSIDTFVNNNGFIISPKIYEAQHSQIESSYHCIII